MATKAQRTVTIMEAIADRDLTNAKIIRLVKKYLAYDETEGLTNNQIADRFLDTIREHVIDQIRRGATIIKAKEVQEEVNQAAIGAEEDL